MFILLSSFPIYFLGMFREVFDLFLVEDIILL
jgi:hypothetical protein